MKTTLVIGAIGAIITGLIVGIQSTVSSRAGSMIGEVQTGILSNLMAGIFAALLVILFLFRGGISEWKISQNAFGLVTFSGLLGILVITGVSFSLQRVGIAAGLAAILMSQLLVSMLVDTFGIGGAEPIPLTMQRVAGLFVLGSGVYLMMPRW